MNFEIVIIGSDINAYYMARCCHEAYNKKAFLLAKQEMNFTGMSNILNIEYCGNLWDENIFTSELIKFANKHATKKLILIPSNDFYVRLINEKKNVLKKYYLFNSISLSLLNNLLIKDNFYTNFKNSGLDFPKTIIFNCNEKKNITNKDVDEFEFPIIVKPGNGVDYYNHKFLGQAKVYKINSFNELKTVVSSIKRSGYKEKLIVQEFIPGGDDHLFDSILYCNKEHKVVLASFAQIGLQEHTSTGIGNCTVLINGYNQFPGVKEQVEKMIAFLEKEKYSGFAEFDLKYDERDKKYKVFEINPRQARSSYYLTACGHNLIKYIVDDLLLNKSYKYKFISKKMVLSFVPSTVIKKYINNKDLKKEIKLLKRKKCYVDPLNYKKDKSFKRKMWLFARKINYIKKYKNNKW